MEDDAQLVEQAAREALKEYGRRAAQLLRERAELADAIEDESAVKEWRRLAAAIDRLNETQNPAASPLNAVVTTELYASPNGDNWLFVCHPCGRAFVRHQANFASGGHQRDIEVADFLARSERNPEHLALLRLLRRSAAGTNLT